jgi:hypothetical protein
VEEFDNTQANIGAASRRKSPPPYLSILLFVFFALYFLAGLFGMRYNEIDAKFRLLFTLIIVCAMLFCLFHIIMKANSKIINIFAILLLVLFQVLNIVFSNDYGQEYTIKIEEEQSIRANTIGTAPFFTYSYNHKALWLMALRFFYVITGSMSQHYWITMSVFSIILVDTSLIFAYLIAKELFNKKVAVLTILLFAFIFSYTTFYFYTFTEAPCMPFITGSIYIIIRLLKTKSPHKKLLLCCAAGITLGLGYLIKPSIATVIFVLFIGLGTWFFKNCKNKKLVLYNCKFVLAGLFCFTFIIGGFYTVVLPNQSIVPYKKDEGAPVIYFLAQNITAEHFNEELYDIERSGEYSSKELRKKYISLINSTLKDYGFKGYFNNIKNKFYMLPAEGFLVEPFVVDDEMRVGDITPFTNLIVDATWLIILFGICLAMFSKQNMYIKLLPFFILFLLLFVVETAQRYQISHLPIFCIVAADGYFWAFQKIKKFLCVR